MANEVAWAASERFEPQYDLGIRGHIGLKCSFKLPSLRATVRVLRNPTAFPLHGESVLVDDDERDAAWKLQMERQTLDEVKWRIAIKELPRAVAELGQQGTEFLFKLCKIPDGEKRKYRERGCTVRFQVQRIAALSARSHGGVAMDSKSMGLANIAR